MITVKDLDDFKRLRVLVIGDAMVDRYEFCEPVKLSQEAAVPVARPVETVHRPGGAANLMANINALGVALVSIVAGVGHDPAGRLLAGELGRHGGDNKNGKILLTDSTTIKWRIYAGSQQVCRLDVDAILAADEESAEAVRAAIASEKWDIIAVSDYAKGVVNEKSLEAIRESRVPFAVDGKRRFDRYRGATFIKGSQQDLVGNHLRQSDLETLMRHLSVEVTPATLFMTLGGDGIAWAQDGDTAHYATRAVDVRDTTGAGDVAMASLVCAWAAGWAPEKAARLANISAGISVGRVGTTVVTKQDIANQIYDHRAPPRRASEKIIQPEVFGRVVEHWRSQGHRIGVANGCFDLLHAGHLAYLSWARHNCDRLLVLVNGDDSYCRLRGRDPLVPEGDRALLVAGFSCVDGVAIFGPDSPADLIRDVRPDVYVHGWDHDPNGAECDAAREVGALVIGTRRYEDHSSTAIKEKARA